jgi:hypothetical protein
LTHVTRHFGHRSAQELLEGNEEYFKHQPCVSIQSHTSSSLVTRHSYYPWLKALCERGRKVQKKHPLWYRQINIYFLLSLGSFNSQVALFTSKLELFPAVSTFERHTPICTAIIIFIIIADIIWGQECIPAHCSRQTQSFQSLSSQC